MKKLLFSALFTILSLALFAQSGVIYNFTFRIDDELTTQVHVQNKDHKILNLSTIEDMPKELSDTIILVSEEMLGELLGVELSSMVPEEKMVMAAMPEHLMYLPANRFKKAVKENSEANIFINISCHIAASGGTKVSLGNKSFSKVKPKLTLTIKVQNADKEEIDSRKVVLKDFEKLRSKTFEKTYGIKGLGTNTDEVTESETLNSNDVLRMYVMALSEAVK